MPPPPLSTLPVTHLPRLIGFEDLCHPISGSKISASGRQHEGEGTDSPRTAPTAAFSQLLGPPSTSVKNRLPSDVTLPSNAPALRSVAPGLHTNRPSILPLNSQLNRTTPAAEQPTTSTAQLESFSTTPFSAAGPLSPKAEMAFRGSTSESGTRWRADQMMVLDTEKGSIQVPVDVKAASKVAQEKRKRNTTATQHFRQRQKEKERKHTQYIAELKKQIRETDEEREYYRSERDYFQEIAVRMKAPLLPRPISPRRRASLSEPGWQPLNTLEAPCPRFLQNA